jgi:hypothetical protein
MQGRAEPGPVASDALLAGELLATLDSLAETRIRAFNFSASTRTEPLAFLTGRQHQSSSTFSCGLALDLCGFLQEDPVRHVAAMQSYWRPAAVQAALTAPVFMPDYAYAFGDPVAKRDPDGLGKIDPRCWYWGYVCTHSSADCKQRWRCAFLDMSPEEQYQYFQAAGVSSESAFFVKVCFLGLPSCQKMIKYCGELAATP